ncbi:carboxypeptidase-like regulatory domain-containing protein [Mucilaginibacter sp. RS28]|uniref:Carboxypeptidase-like regulatory domain-containing protein n=1 Tax=Mucilaginibacter straminoryzae TaxID=2932774 RepID=A0A9X1X3K8_9SPHI|nr:carboxypeptidase-like regulatory domain-containing protein [Mucilaginibacter straminoryzae]MCJ8209455.1 carboxypeptidase-like regulatory domain-containing protein [Mucilaginibacter straminoryzae]
MSSFLAVGQQLRGRVFEDKTHTSLAGIKVVNTRTAASVVTNKDGYFEMGVKLNDMLVLSGFNYQRDTVIITDLKTTEFFMAPVGHMLNEVKVKASEQVNKTATAPVFDRDYHGQTFQYQIDPKTGGYKGGVNLRFFNNSEERKRKREQEMMANDVISTEISRVFSEENISKYVPLKGTELKAFIIRYSPDIKTYKSPEFNLSSYLNNCYKAFMQLSPEQRIKTSIFN